MTSHHWITSRRPNRWGLTFSRRGTARVTFADGTYIILTHQSSPAQALRRADRLRRQEQRRMTP